jgi:hypothetical protein
MSDPMLKLQILVRAELALADIHGRRAASRSAYFAVALVFLLLGLAMLTVAIYQALLPVMGAAWAAFTVAMVDTVIGIMIALAARRAGPSENEEKLAREIRDMAYAELNSDIEQVKSQFNQMTAEIKRIRSGISSFTSGAVGSVVPVLNMLVKAIKRK